VLRQQPLRERRRVRERLAVVPHELRQRGEEVRPGAEEVVLGPQPLRDLGGVAALVEAVGVEADGEGGDRLRRLPLRDRRHEARVDPPAQEDAERHVAAQAEPHRGGEQLVDPVDRVVVAPLERLGSAPGSQNCRCRIPPASTSSSVAASSFEIPSKIVAGAGT
jgi:hypothetical protein